MVRYLSLDWIDALRHEVAATPELTEVAAGRRVGVTQVVTGGPEGDVTYHLQLDDGQITFGPGAADPQDVCFVQDWDTAVAVATGRLNAQEAFLKGRIRFTGDHQLLLDSQPVFQALDGVFAAVRRHTEYC